MNKWIFYRSAVQLVAKSKLEQLRGNVEAQEARLEDAMNSFKSAKANESSSNGGNSLDQHWDNLERVVGLIGDLLSSYRDYTTELERRLKRAEK